MHVCTWLFGAVYKTDYLKSHKEIHIKTELQSENNIWVNYGDCGEDNDDDGDDDNINITLKIVQNVML
jgi:hypothetical protein